MRDIVHLQCEVCKRRNYTATKSKEKKNIKITLKKYCKWCRKHTLHKEVK
ncbi:MAG: 50S ribosomal protein L33 [candidate division WOR-3 bacterium]|uniref:Large ribosomal subunit protein bL33 n=1 Tax=candidate division WOR-3 bacterium TaxID=2052148 RepID=A0A7V3ZT33_UNCW3